MKYIFFSLSLILTSIFTLAQNTNPFANQTFQINNYIDGKFDNEEDLIFSTDQVEGSVCVQYGFARTSYTATQNADGKWTFSCTMLSPEHGKMVWEGTKEKDGISGRYLWTKTGQDPIHYTFKGKLK